MKKTILTLTIIGFSIVGFAQNEKPSTDPNPDSLQNKANYNTTRTSKTIKADKTKEKKEKATTTGSGGGNQSFKASFILPFEERNFIR